jgi:hypothetical protein
MKQLATFLLALVLLPAVSGAQTHDRPNASVYIFMDTTYGAMVSRYRLQFQGIEMPLMYGYRHLELNVPAGQYLIESHRDGVGGTSLNLKAVAGQKHYIFINPIGFPRPTPVLTLVDQQRGLSGLRLSEVVTVSEDSLRTLAEIGVRVPGQPITSHEQTALSGTTQGRQDTQPDVADNRTQVTTTERPGRDADSAQQTQAELDRLRTEVEELRRRQAGQAPSLGSVAQPQLSTAASTGAPPAAPVVTAMPPGNRRALIIGNNQYENVPRLSNAGEDARTIAGSLLTLGYQVTLRTDLNERQMKSTIRTFAGQIEGGDEVVFFFAGHGVQLGSANYLLPTDVGGDSEAQVRDEAIPLQRVLDDLSDRKAKLTLAIVDACRDNPFKSLGRSIGGRGLAPTTAATGQMVIFSAGAGQQALDRLGQSDEHKNSVFTRVFVTEMQRPGVSIDRIIKNVRARVAELAKSVGHEQVPAIYDQVLGDYYFRK